MGNLYDTTELRLLLQKKKMSTRECRSDVFKMKSKQKFKIFLPDISNSATLIQSNDALIQRNYFTKTATKFTFT